MFTNQDLQNSGENAPIWEFLGKNSLREAVFDLLLDTAIQHDYPTENLTNEALRSQMARVDFIRRMRDELPHSPEDINRNTGPLVEPEPIQ